MGAQSRQSDEADSGGPTYKRRRVGLACKSCRSRKSRCDGAEPSCGLCIELGFDCVYERPARSGMQHGNKSEPTDRLAAIERVVEMLVQRDKSRSDQEHLGNQDIPSQAPNPQSTAVVAQHVPQQPAPKSQHETRDVNSDTDSHEHSGEESIDGLATVSSFDHRGSRFFGPSSNIALLRLAGAATPPTWQKPETLLKNDAELRKRTPAGTTLINSRSSRKSEDASVDCWSLPPETHGLQLLKTFFSDTGMLFPYVHEVRAVQLFTSMLKTGSTSCSPSAMCLIQIILAFGARTSLDTSVVEQGDSFANRAQSLIPKMEMRAASIETVQSLLLVTQYLQGTQKSDETWAVFGLALRTALHLGLQSSTAIKGLNPLDGEIRKRTWFGCVTLDTSLSLTFGRPPAIPNSYTRLELPINRDLDRLSSRDTSEHQILSECSQDTVLFFIATVELYSMQRDILANLYDSNLESNVSMEAAELVHQTLLLDQRMHKWFTQLPPQLGLKPWIAAQPYSRVQPLPPPIFEKLSTVMRLRFLNTQILLCRPMLTLIIRCKASAPSTDLPQTGRLSEHITSHCISSCESAASEVIEIVHSAYANPTLLGAAWFSAYYTFNASLILYIYSLLLIYSDTVHPPNVSRSSIQASTVAQINTSLGKLHNAIEAIYGVSGGAAWGTRLCDIITRLAQLMSTFLKASDSSQSQTPADGLAGLEGTNTLYTSPSKWYQVAQLPFIADLSSSSGGMAEPFVGDLSSELEPSWHNDFMLQNMDFFLASSNTM